MASTNSFRPSSLPVDARRIVVVGTTGSGKTTLARLLAQRLGVDCVEMDALHWEPNWTPAPRAVFRKRVAEAVESESWVADGNYRVVRDIVWPRATTLVWLEYPLRLIMWRLFWRTLRRGIRKEQLWNGNQERLATQFFTRDSLFLWALGSHPRHRKEYPELFEQTEYSHLAIVRLRSPKAAERWLSGLSMQN